MALIGAVFDMECTGLLPHMLREEGSQIHCAMFQEFTYEDDQLVKGVCREFYDEPLGAQGDDWVYMGRLDGLPAYLDSLDCLCGHNIIEYDLPIVFDKLNYRFSKQVLDSLIISRKNWPDRPGGHSVEAWGQRLGDFKVEHEDWSVMTPEVRHRCRKDALLETDILIEVLKEMWIGVERCQTG